MNKSELITAIAEKTGESIAQTSRTLEALLETLSEQLGQHQSVTLLGFGRFEVKHRPARQGRNPKTGEPLHIAARVQPVFKPGKTLKQRVDH